MRSVLVVATLGAALLLAGCGQGPAGPKGESGPTGPGSPASRASLAPMDLPVKRAKPARPGRQAPRDRRVPSARKATRATKATRAIVVLLVQQAPRDQQVLQVSKAPKATPLLGRQALKVTRAKSVPLGRRAPQDRRDTSLSGDSIVGQAAAPAVAATTKWRFRPFAAPIRFQSQSVTARWNAGAVLMSALPWCCFAPRSRAQRPATA